MLVFWVHFVLAQYPVHFFCIKYYRKKSTYFHSHVEVHLAIEGYISITHDLAFASPSARLMHMRYMKSSTRVHLAIDAIT